MGSFPGEASLKARRYYAHEKNLFWEIVFAALQEDDPVDYRRRIGVLRRHKIGLWDVLKTCRRKGSSDSAIRRPAPNDLRKYIGGTSGIKAVFLNGKTASRLFKRYFGDVPIRSYCLPSTSPANAGQGRAFKKRKWKIIARS